MQKRRFCLIFRANVTSGECAMTHRCVPTTALRKPENYGLRGWISTRSSDLAQGLLKYIPRPFVRGRIVQHFLAIRRNALGFYQGSASGMTMSKGQMGRRLLGFAVAGVALLARGGGFSGIGAPPPWGGLRAEMASARG